MKSLVSVGIVALPIDQARHARDVLRLTNGAIVELFDDVGHTARGTIDRCDADGVEVRIEQIERIVANDAREIIVASAIPKGDRADWMIEKLSEIGVMRFLPLASERSVVLAEGKNKRERWIRIATEAAKQSNRAGVMSIEGLMPVDDALRATSHAMRIVMTTEMENARGLFETLSCADLPQRPIALFIGPEGGWTDRELARFASDGLIPARLTTTILRVETAAVVAAALVASRGASTDSQARSQL